QTVPPRRPHCRPASKTSRPPGPGPRHGQGWESTELQPGHAQSPILTLLYGLTFRNHFTAATSASNTPVRILPSDFVCTQMRYGPDFGNAYGNETSPAAPTLFVWLP